MPAVYAVDLARSTIYMELVAGPSVKQLLRAAYTGQQGYSLPLAALAASIGDAVARMHDLNIVHGDLTTSNMIAAEEGAAEEVVRRRRRPRAGPRALTRARGRR